MNKTLPLSQWLARFGILGIMLTLLSACFHNGSTSTSSDILSGTAATGAPIVGYVYVTDANGVEVNTPIQADGSYSIDVTGMTPPFMLRAVPDDNSLPTQYSYAAGTGRVNITPLSNLSLFMASTVDLSAIYAAWDGTGIIMAAIAAAQEVINANLTAQFIAAGLDPLTYNFLTARFNADRSGFDSLLDAIRVRVNRDSGVDFTIPGNNGTISGNVGFTFNKNIDTSNMNIGGSSGSSAGSLTLSGQSALPSTFTPATSLLETLGGIETISFAMAINTTETLSIVINTTYGYTSITHTNGSTVKNWSESYHTGNTLSIDTNAKTVTFNAFIATSYPDESLLTVNGTVSYQ